MTVAPCRPTTLSPADRLACSMALATPSVTNVKTAGYGSVGLLWVTTKQGMSPTGPPSPQPPSPSFLSNDLRPITTAPQSSSISCRRARSSSVAASNIQSCSVWAPSPNGFSRLSFGPVTYPSSEIDISQTTSAMASLLPESNHKPQVTKIVGVRSGFQLQGGFLYALGVRPSGFRAGPDRRACGQSDVGLGRRLAGWIDHDERVVSPLPHVLIAVPGARLVKAAGEHDDVSGGAVGQAASFSGRQPGRRGRGPGAAVPGPNFGPQCRAISAVDHEHAAEAVVERAGCVDPRSRRRIRGGQVPRRPVPGPRV